MAACFLSPVAYVTMVVYLAVSGWTFLQVVERHVGSRESPEILLCISIVIWLPVLITVISMRLFAEEKRAGTIESLMTVPVTDLQVVLGKYAGGLSFLVAVILPSTWFIFILAMLSPGLEFIDAGALFGGCLLLFLISALCVSLGMLVSLMTRNQIIAAICCFCAICLPFLIRYLILILPWMPVDAVDYVAADVHIMNFARGIIDTRPIVFYVSGTCVMLFAAVKVLESRRWR